MLMKFGPMHGSRILGGGMVHNTAANMVSGRGHLILVCFFLLTFLGEKSMARPSLLAHTQQKYIEGDCQIFRADLLHRDHHHSPLQSLETIRTFVDRVTTSVDRSISRKFRFARRLTANDFHASITNGLAAGEYVMSINLGTPPQKFSAIFDTGSDLVWVQCDPCISCKKQTNPLFDTGLSSSYVVLPCTDPMCILANDLGDFRCNSRCRYLYEYGDSSYTSGLLSMETVTLTDLAGTAAPIHNISFGCGNKRRGDFFNADGLVGFGQGPLSLPSQIGKTKISVFSYCLVTFGAAATISSQLFFGPEASAEGALLGHVEILSNPAFPSVYYVNMTGISVGGVALEIPVANFQLDVSSGDGGVFFDTGTTVASFDKYTMDLVVQQLTRLTSHPVIDTTPYGDFPVCYDITESLYPDLPSMVFHFAGVNGMTQDFPLSFDNMFFTINISQGQAACLAMIVDTPPFVIGNVQQADHYIEYDLLHRRIGWDQRKC